jgi:hypothetical protein
MPESDKVDEITYEGEETLASLQARYVETSQKVIFLEEGINSQIL